MKMDSWGKSIKSGLIYGIVISVTCIIFTVFVYFLTNGESFLRENETIKAIGKIQSNMVINIGLVLSAIITIFFIRYKRIISYASELGLVIVGTDKRGTIYGIYHISEKMGVSPLQYRKSKK